MNSGDCWPRNAFIKKPGLITVSIGAPIPSEGMTAAELIEKVENWIESEMRSLSPAAYTNEKPL
jgi:1-acyl-sn-glycerol-3-phosphate acyltransferase